MKKTFFTTLALCSILALPAYAGHCGDHDKYEAGKARWHMDSMMRKMDKDNDGIITMDEHEAYNAHKFAKMDRNNDRKITPQEMMDYKKSKMRHDKMPSRMHDDRMHGDMPHYND